MYYWSGTNLHNSNILPSPIVIYKYTTLCTNSLPVQCRATQSMYKTYFPKSPQFMYLRRLVP